MITLIAIVFFINTDLDQWGCTVYWQKHCQKAVIHIGFVLMTFIPGGVFLLQEIIHLRLASLVICSKYRVR